jgi:hypothetical protein
MIIALKGTTNPLPPNQSGPAPKKVYFLGIIDEQNKIDHSISVRFFFQKFNKNHLSSLTTNSEWSLQKVTKNYHSLPIIKNRSQV